MEKTGHELARRILAQLLAMEGADVEWPGGAENVRIQRTYAGHHQRSAGAWTWALGVVHPTFGVPSIGSQYPAREVARGFTIYRDYYGDVHLDPVTASKPAEVLRGED